MYRAGDYAVPGDKKKCLQTLQKVVDGDYFNYPLMLMDTDLDSMRDDPEFQEILMGAKIKHEAFKERLF